MPWDLKEREVILESPAKRVQPDLKDLLDPLVLLAQEASEEKRVLWANQVHLALVDAPETKDHLAWQDQWDRLVGQEYQ